MASDVLKPVRIDKHHKTGAFDCGEETLNTWLKRFALPNDASDSAKTVVVSEKNSNQVVAYYSLATGSVEPDDATARIKKGLSRNPIPVVLLARLAVDLKYQGMGLGKGLLKDSILNIINASEYVGIRAILVHAKNEKALAFYEKYGFELSPVKELMMMLLLKDARKSV